MSSDNPPPYANLNRSPAASDSKYGFDSAAYSVDNTGPSIYPSAHDYVPPGVEHVSRDARLPAPSAPQMDASVAQQQQQQQQYAQPQQLVGQTNVYYTRPGVPVQVPTATGGMMVIGGGSVNFHIYRDGWVSRDCRILTADKKSVAYHIDYPYSFFGSWHVNMRRGSSQGPTAFLITKSAMGWDFTIQDPVNPALTTKLTRSGGGVLGKRKHSFKGFDGKNYAWKGHGLGGDLKCVCYPTKTIIAFYHRTKHSWSKEGRLEILPNGHHLLDLVVATGFAVEEWERQNR
ncbi:hypothetical protein SpCBS45565_g03431 [Spizellomyces sp. 'palustris']|nr:hypothetical protein SpCBS45565_g03431 [Spizellomyces sp. 'palustris']